MPPRAAAQEASRARTCEPACASAKAADVSSRGVRPPPLRSSFGQEASRLLFFLPVALPRGTRLRSARGLIGVVAFSNLVPGRSWNRATKLSTSSPCERILKLIPAATVKGAVGANSQTAIRRAETARASVLPKLDFGASLCLSCGLRGEAWVALVQARNARMADAVLRHYAGRSRHAARTVSCGLDLRRRPVHRVRVRSASFAFSCCRGRRSA